VKLTLLSGALNGTEFEFHEPAVCVLGRAEECRPRLPETMDHYDVSGHHCLLIVNPPAVQIMDLGSTNGTFVNGVKIGQRVPLRSTEGRVTFQPFCRRRLRDGDSIRLGRFTILRVHVQAGQGAEA
jgi:pSer/pThr/pTyr-binding forkhead associated (FHA) protein